MTGTPAKTSREPAIGWTREGIAERVAQDIENGSYVNLGIGIPELVARFVPAGRTLVYHTENGLLGMGPSPAAGQGDPELINAGKRRVTMMPGAAFFDQATSFAMIRGGHLDLSVLGALPFQQAVVFAGWFLVRGSLTRRCALGGWGRRWLGHGSASLQDRPTRVAALIRAEDTRLLQLFHQAAGPAVADAQFALQERDGGSLLPKDDVDHIGQQFVLEFHHRFLGAHLLPQRLLDRFLGRYSLRPTLFFPVMDQAA